MGFNGNEKNGYDSRANEMLRGLNNKYKEEKFAEKYGKSEEYERSGDGSIQIDISTLSDAEFKLLFDNYIASSKMSVNDMTPDSYKSLQYHIVNLQRQSGAMLMTGDEMEKRFADAEKAKTLLSAIEDDDDDFGATTEFIQPESKMEAAYASAEEKAPAEAASAEEADAEDIPVEEVPVEEPSLNTEEIRSLPTEEIAMISEENIHDAEIIKKRRMSVFSHLKSLLRDGEEDTEPEVQEIEVPEFSYTPETDDDDIEGATTEFISPFTAERDAIAASEMQSTEIFDSVRFFTAETHIPKAEIEQNEENTEEMPAYEPNEATGEIEAPAEEILAEETLAEETPAEVLPEEPEIELYEKKEEITLSAEDSQIIDAFCADPIEDRADVPKDIFGDTTVETQETAVEDAEEEEEEESDNYVSFDQNPEVLQEYRGKYNSVKIRMGISAFLAVLVLVFENIGIFGVQLPDFMCNEAFAVPFEWTAIFLAGALASDVIWGALKKLVKFEFEPASVTLFALIFAAAATMIPLFTESEPKFYNFPFVLCVFLNLLAVYLTLRKEIFSFKIISSTKKKHAVTLMKASEAAPEAKEFAECLSENSQFYRAREAEFVDGYFAKRKHAPKMYKKLRVVLPIAFVAAVAAAVLSIVLKNVSIYEGMVNGYLTFMMAAPVAVFFANELPMYFSTVNAYSHNSAILGDSAPEMMENMSCVSFSDKDVFLAGDSVRVKGVKVVGNNRIDNIIYYATSVFELVGGPLAKTFKQASLDDAAPENAEIRIISENGIDATVDGKHIVVGTYGFMDTLCFNPVKEANDAQWEGKTHKRVLYLACDEKIIAKFYIEYNVNPEFVYLVKKLSKAGICTAIRTNDPCVDTELFYKNKLTAEHHFAVIKGVGEDEEKTNVSASKTGLVAAGSLKGLIKTLIVCDKLRSVQKTNFVIKTVAAVIGILAMGFIIAAGIPVSAVWSIYFALYQLLWIVPVYVVSKVNI
jgi:hypothetical protein